MLEATREQYDREHPMQSPRTAIAGVGPPGAPPIDTEPMAPMQRSGETRRDHPIRSVFAPPAQAGEARAHLDALLVCGAARFAAGSTEPEDIEQGLRAVARTELADRARRGMLRVIAHTAAQATVRWRESVQRVLA